MRLENGNVYGNGRGSYMLVFNTTNFGATFAYCNTDDHVQDVYQNIPELKIDDTVGTVCIDRIIYVPWTKMSTAKYKLYKKLSRRQYVLIINAISALYLGDIVIEGTAFEYIDRIPYTASLNIPTVEDDKIPEVKKKITEGAKDTILDVEEPKETKDKIAALIVQNKVVSTNFEVPTSEILKKAEEAGIPIYYGPETTTGEQFFDLLPTTQQERPSAPRSGKFNDNPSYRAPARSRRHLFSENECISIACSSIAMVAEKYEVSKSDAAQMVNNAKKLFNDEKPVTRSKPEITVKEIYESGISLEDAIFKYRNIPADRIRRYYQDMSITKDDRAAIEKWDAILASSDKANLKLIITAARSDVHDFNQAERCSVSTAENILGKINKILAFNPLYVVFGDRAYEEDLEDTFQNGRNSNKNLIDSYIYRIALRLSDPYKATYNYHYDILHGNKPIPEGVSEADKEFFLAMIYNHYNPRMILGRNRHLTRAQREALESFDAERVARTFAVQTSRARSLINSYKLKLKRESRN